MEEAIRSTGLLVLVVIVLTGLWLVWRRECRVLESKQDAWAAEQEAQRIELAEQRRLRELEERRRGLLRGRERACRFCGIEGGCLTLDDMCMEVEPCLARAGVPNPAGLTN